jgi:large subunit ribosomal protein L3
MLGLMGKKLGMTQVFAADGSFVPVTVLEVGPCTVVQRKTKETDGYDALQLGFGEAKPKRLNKPQRGHLEKKGLKHFQVLREFRTASAGKFEIGQVLSVKGFKTGDVIDVIGTSKGRGYQGVIKRHGKHGGFMSHGSDFHRRPGSTGMGTWPGRLFKNTRLPGHMGVDRVTVKNISVVEVRAEDNVLLIKGAVPGPKDGYILVVSQDANFENRENLILKTKTEQAKAAAPAAKEAAKVDTKEEAKEIIQEQAEKEEKPASAKSE